MECSWSMERKRFEYIKNEKEGENKMLEHKIHERRRGFVTGTCCPMGYGHGWSVPFWTHKLSRNEEAKALEQYAKDLKAELEEVNREIKSLKKGNA